MKKILAGLVLCVLAGFRAEAQESDLQRIADVLDVSTTKTFQFTANGRMFSPGQNSNPNAPWPRSYVKSLTRQYDFTAGEMREEMVRTQGEDPPSGGAGQPLAGESRTVALVRGDLAWNDSGKTVTPQPHQATGRSHEIAISPHGLVRAAFATNRPSAKRMSMDGQ